jgi:para-nitrobenzyl esterase
MRIRKLAAVVFVLVALTLAGLVAGCGGGFDTVQLTAGPVTGAVQKVDGAQIWTFKGIPYAAPPVGELRWRPPQPVDAWTETLACTEFGPSCPQEASGEAGPFSVDSTAVDGTSEDCL